jgi:hypothetical protein
MDVKVETKMNIENVVTVKEQTENMSGDKWWSFLGDVENYLKKKGISCKHLGGTIDQALREASFVFENNEQTLIARRFIMGKFLKWN